MRVMFLTEPRLQTSGNGAQWLLAEPFVVWIESGDSGDAPIVLTVPTGFNTDLASVPRLPGAYLLFAGRARRSAILHDYLYELRFPRAWADAVFRAAMVEEDVGPLARWAMWLGVRIGGGRIYDAHAAPEPDPYQPQ